MNDLKRVTINVGYDILTKPNLHNYIVEPKWNQDSKTNITTLLDNTSGNFNENFVHFFVRNNSKFIYPIILFDNYLFDNNDTIDLNSEVVLSVQQKKCRIVFVYLLEGYFNTFCVNWINSLCQKYNFSKNDVVVITSNLIKFSDNNFTIINYNYFGNHINFLSVSKLDSIKINQLRTEHDKFLLNDFKFHFLCFNGIPRENRLMMFNELTTNPKMRNKSITTLRGIDKNYWYDVPSWDNQKIGGGARLNIDAHSKSFLNIVTETLYDSETIFISEKTYKPIYLCQPFIIFGNPFTLKKLHELGYKTFNHWWDESYDLETDLKKRFEKIVKIIEKLSDLSLTELSSLKNEMRDVVVNNYSNFFNSDDIKNLLLELRCGDSEKKLI